MPYSPVSSTALPVFRGTSRGRVLFYSPGYLAAVDPAGADRFEKSLGSPPAESPAASLVEHATQALRGWQELLERPYRPVCLTIYPTNRCNLRCAYCFADAGNPEAEAGRVSLDAVRAAAPAVIGNCLARGRPLIIVFHGGGEPTLARPDVDAILDFLESEAEHHNLPVFRYIATNGILAQDGLDWLADRFDLVGLSCDGPAPVQDAQRPRADGRGSAEQVEQTARFLRASGKRLHVRVTVTAASVRRLPEIARSVCQILQPEEIHVEPVYRGGRAGKAGAFTPEDTAAFIDGFFEAEDIAAGYGIRWTTSGGRLGEIHGPYCNLLRDVFQLTPGDEASACFKLSGREQVRGKGMSMPQIRPAAGTDWMDSDRLQELRRRLTRIPPECESCFNRFHCTRGCPDTCPAEDPLRADEARCRLQAGLAERRLERIAAARLTANEAVQGTPLGGLPA